MASELRNGAICREGTIYVKHNDVLEIVKKQEFYLYCLKIVAVAQTIMAIVCRYLFSAFLNTTPTLLMVGNTINFINGFMAGFLLSITFLFHRHQRGFMSTLKDPDWENLPGDHNVEVLPDSPKSA